MWVSNISYLRRDLNKNITQFYALQRETGHPLVKIDFEVYGQKYVPDDRAYKFFKLSSGKTNSEGGFEFEKQPNEYNNYKVVFINGEDRFESNNYYSYYYNNDPVIKRTTTFFYLDRAIYRPGQIVYFKGLMINTDGKKDHDIVTDKKTT